MAIVAEIASAALDLPPEDRLELARTLFESVATPDAEHNVMREGIRKIEDVGSGSIVGPFIGWPVEFNWGRWQRGLLNSFLLARVGLFQRKRACID